ncbi:MAG TPA: AraC family transcriptional regulator [Feifaniaceae bacterium]|nr:AraC family transcriptional regulator [Feifaniaceae bacterium]
MRNYFAYPVSASCLPNGFELNAFSENNIQRVYSHHHEFYELYLFLCGSAEFLIEGQATPLEPYTLLLIPPGRTHSLRFLESGSVYRRTVLWLSPELFCRLAPERWENPLELRLGDEDGADIERLLQLLEGEQSRLERDFSDFAGKETLFADYIRLMLVLIARLSTGGAADSAFLGRAQGYIEAHLMDDLSADAVARALHMGKSHLMRRFAREAGVSLHQYILKLRLQRAKRLLSRGVPAGEAASGAGFLDYTTFYKAFLREYGLSPSRFLGGFSVSPAGEGEGRSEDENKFA